MSGVISQYYPNAGIVSIPVADGGEGTVDAFIAAMGGEKVYTPAAGPYFNEVPSFYGRISRSVAVIEMAAAAGLPLVGDEKHAEKTTTFGVGQLIRHAAESGAEKIIIGLGGSATNDGGAGCAAALGVRFYDDAGREFVPVGETLANIRRIDVSGLFATVSGIQFVAMCDIDNPLCGENGAAAVFGPQKGADAATVKMLDEGLRHLACIIRRDLGKDVLALPGGGAAGGMGAGAAAFLGSGLRPGIETVLDTVGFNEIIRGADLIISGEGRLDTQSLRGKVVIGVARRAKAAGVPLVAIVGDIGDNIEKAYELGVTGIFSINRVAVPYGEARLRAKEDLRLTVDNLMRACVSIP